MPLIADACALIDFMIGAEDMGEAARSAIEDEAAEIQVLAATVWEITIKTALGKLPELRAPGERLSEVLAGMGFVLIPLTPQTAELAAGLPPHHKDPFDRALVAYARETGYLILTSDRAFEAYGVETIWS